MPRTRRSRLSRCDHGKLLDGKWRQACGPQFLTNDIVAREGRYARQQSWSVIPAVLVRKSDRNLVADACPWEQCRNQCSFVRSGSDLFPTNNPAPIPHSVKLLVYVCKSNPVSRRRKVGWRLM